MKKEDIKSILDRCFDVVDIGAETTEDLCDYKGFEHLNKARIDATIAERHDSKPMNIIINMHGIVEGGEYLLTRDLLVDEDQDTGQC